jgi:hypothetical protein
VTPCCSLFSPGWHRVIHHFYLGDTVLLIIFTWVTPCCSSFLPWWHRVLIIFTWVTQCCSSFLPGWHRVIHHFYLDDTVLLMIFTWMTPFYSSFLPGWHRVLIIFTWVIPCCSSFVPGWHRVAHHFYLGDTVLLVIFTWVTPCCSSSLLVGCSFILLQWASVIKKNAGIIILLSSWFRWQCGPFALNNNHSLD